MTRTIRAIGELSYDEGALKTISAYVDGRLERLYADYTGVVVKKGDHLALVYSPRLYSAQVELLLARKSREESRSATLQRVMQSNRELYDSARQRLIELGMTAEQADEFVASQRADGAPDFSIRPVPGSPRSETPTVHYVTQFFEPTPASGSLEGFDLATDPIRCESLHAAVRLGEATISGELRKQKLAQWIGTKPPPPFT